MWKNQSVFALLLLCLYAWTSEVSGCRICEIGHFRQFSDVGTWPRAHNAKRQDDDVKKICSNTYSEKKSVREQRSAKFSIFPSLFVQAFVVDRSIEGSRSNFVTANEPSFGRVGFRWSLCYLRRLFCSIIFGAVFHHWAGKKGRRILCGGGWPVSAPESSIWKFVLL